MNNINILIEKATREVHLSKSVIGNDGENLQENLVFSFDEFVDGTARVELLKSNEEKSYIMLEKVDETYQLPIRSVLTKSGRLNLQLVITQGSDDEEIPIFKSNKFYLVVNSSINAEIEEPEEYPQWIDVANTKLNEIDNVDIDAEKEGHTATITITQKDGTEKTVIILDGEQGPQGEQGIQGIQGPQGPAGKDGKDGVDGKDGKDGADGTNGVNGQDGRDGVIQYTAGSNITITNNNVISANVPDISGKLDTSKVKSSYSTTSGDVYDVSYINNMVGDINTILATLTTPSDNGGGN